MLGREVLLFPEHFEPAGICSLLKRGSGPIILLGKSLPLNFGNKGLESNRLLPALSLRCRAVFFYPEMAKLGLE